MEGNVFVVYNMGTQDFPIGETAMKVNDNRYHVIRFTRTGANATLQLDDQNIQQNNPTGTRNIAYKIPLLKIFNFYNNN